MASPFGQRSNISQFLGGGPNLGEHAGEKVAQWQRAVGTVTGADLDNIGVAGHGIGTTGAYDAVEPETQKFDAMLALQRAQSRIRESEKRTAGLNSPDSTTRFGVDKSLYNAADQAQGQLDDANMVAAGKDEVLRRRQKEFNDYTADVQTGKVKEPAWNPYFGNKNLMITGQTGAALASHARAGKIATMPEAQRAMTVGQHMADHPSWAQFGLPGQGINQDSMKMRPTAMSGLDRARSY